MKSKIYLLIIAIASGSLYMSFTQKEKFIQYLSSVLENHTAHVQFEKVYVQTDKTFYLPGEDIWFSVYLVNEGNNTPSDLSEVVYVDLINPKGNVVAKRTLATLDGNSEGDFHLDTLDAGGIYTLKVYTNWMKNFGEENFFEKKITVQKIITPRVLLKLDFEREAYGRGDKVVADFSIKNLKNEPLTDLNLRCFLNISGNKISENEIKTDEEGKAKIVFNLPDDLNSNDGLLNVTISYEGFTESISRSIPIILNQIDLQFFPEGGSFVSGLTNRVAFKALNEFGKPADVEGLIFDEDNKIITEFESFHDGMGKFSIAPEKGKGYKAKITKPVGIVQEFYLPIPSSNGVVMKVDSAGERGLFLKIYSLKKETILLAAHQSGKIFFSDHYTLNAGENDLRIPTDNADAGTALLTLFNNKQEPQNERLVFLNSHKKLNINIETDKKEYTPGADVELKIKTTDELNNPVSARLSLSVVNDRIISFADDKQDNILSWLLMSSDVKGDIHEPNFYFDKNEPKAKKALDYVLMTHGWRKFSLKETNEQTSGLAFQAEKIGNVSGVIINKKKNEPMKADVYAFETGPKRRAVKTKTDEHGRFLVKNVDPAYDLVLLASSPFKNRNNITIKIDNEYLEAVNNPPFILSNKKTEDSKIPTTIKVPVKEKKETSANKTKYDPESELSFSLDEDVASLEEVVVVGYGAAAKKDITGSIVVVRKEIFNGVPYANIENVLQGRASGVVVTENSGIPGSSSEVRIRGTNSISNNDPLFVVDGIPVAEKHHSPFLNPQNINSIEVLKGPTASAIYGCRGANGVIIISTNNLMWNYNQRIGEKSFAQYTIRSQRYYRAREFYRPKYYHKDGSPEKDFSSTVYWNPDILTGPDGKATLHFKNSNEVSSFRITAEGISKAGKVGRKEQTLHTILPLSIDSKIPPFVCFGDVIWVPVIIKNNTSNAEKGKLDIEIPAAFEKLNEVPEHISLEANSSHTEWVKLKVKNKEGKFTLKVEFTGSNHVDELTKSVQVLPMGFPVQASLSGYDLSKNFEFEINNAVPGSVKAKFTGFTSTINELMEGISSIIRAPYGCFEQTSSSTYPNILALNLIRETNINDPKTEKIAVDYIKQGYKRLLTFETTEGGFEWFGKTPPHEGLTAYGLMEFYDMKKVYDDVSEKLIDRTAEWLLSRKDGNGGFKRSSKALDSFGRCSQTVSDAYITYAFTEVGKGNLVTQEFNKAYLEAKESEDAYRMALMANAALNLEEHEKADLLIDKLLQQITPDGSGDLKADHSMVRSYGNSLQVEVRALILMALLKQKEASLADIMRQVNYISSKRIGGGFGSTQATILALKALCMYATQNKVGSDNGNIALSVNQKLIAQEAYSHTSLKAVSIDSLERYFGMGKQSVSVHLTGSQQPIPYSLDVAWTSLTPESSPRCKLAIDTKINSRPVKLGETVRIDIELKNLTNEGLPMTMAIVGIPAGLSAQPWQLKELQEKGVFDFYEVRDNYLVLYYREMTPNAVRSIHLDLKSESPGVFQAPASSAYLYYTNEDKHWIEGIKIEIKI